MWTVDWYSMGIREAVDNHDFAHKIHQIIDFLAQTDCYHSDIHINDINAILIQLQIDNELIKLSTYTGPLFS